MVWPHPCLVSDSPQLTHLWPSSSSTTSMPPSTSSRLRQGPTHVTDTGRCPMPCPNQTEVTRLGQLSLCCSRLGASPSSQACSVLFPALWLSRTAVCAATELSVHCSQDPSDLQTISVPSPNWRGEPVVTIIKNADFWLGLVLCLWLGWLLCVY